MSKMVNEVIKEKWILEIFLEWGMYLNEEIELEVVEFGIFVMWWLGCMGIWLKSYEGMNILCDLWCGMGKCSYGNGMMKKGYQMMCMSGV